MRAVLICALPSFITDSSSRPSVRAADQEEPMTELQAAPLTDWTTVAPLKTSLITVGPSAKATVVVAAPASAIGAAITNPPRRAAAAADRLMLVRLITRRLL
jgi:hypothetical protein